MEPNQIEDSLNESKKVEGFFGIAKLKRFIFIILPICFIACFALLLHGIRQEKLKEKFIDIQNYLELLSFYSDFTFENEADFFALLDKGIEYIDSLPHVFAAVYNSNLGIISSRSPEIGTSPFDPRNDRHFMELVRKRPIGNIPVVWEDLEGGITRRTMYTSFRWVPIPNSNDAVCLLAAGVSTYSLMSPALNWFVGGVLGILVICMFAILGFCIYVVGDLYIRFGRNRS